jgi:hypothetical protein
MEAHITSCYASCFGIHLSRRRFLGGLAASLGALTSPHAASAYLELIYLSALIGPQAHMAWLRESKGVSMHEMAEAVKAVGAQHCILSTDLGQTGNPIHPDGYILLVAGLKAEGISQEEIELMLKRHPGKLLGLEA